MKKLWILALALVCITLSTLVRTCPTCIGQPTPDTPPIFTLEYDQYLDQLLEQQHIDDSSTTKGKP
ncbi:MAG TPA: hypothetical protein VLG71_00480 [Candidatus Limnocylindria bacterium]|nr:hypothetical protein [Candidatus Limnocylindria bacterium]